MIVVLISVAWLLATMLAFFSAVMLTCNRLGAMFPEDRIILVSVLGVGILMASLFVSGFLGGVAVGRVLICQLLIAVIVYAISPRSFSGWSLRVSCPPASVATAGIAVLVLLFGLIRAAFNVAFVGDSAAYHIPLARWFVDYGLTIIPSVGDYRELYPANVSLLYAWCICACRGPILVALLNVASSLLLALGAVSLSRHIGIKRRTALWAAPLTLGNYLMVDQVHTGYVDTLFASFLLASIAFIFAYIHTYESRHLVGAALAAGMMLGTKPSGPAYFVLLTCLVVFAPKILGMSLKPRIQLVHVGIWTGLALCFGGYWYLRNLLYTDWGVFPPSQGIELFRRTAILWNLKEFVQVSGVHGFISAIAGQTSWMTATSMVALILVAIRAVQQKGRTLLFAGVVIALVLMLLVHPYSARVGLEVPLAVGGDLRYGIAAIALLNVCWVVVLSSVPGLLPFTCFGLALPASRAVLAFAVCCGHFWHRLSDTAPGRPEMSDTWDLVHAASDKEQLGKR